jgi:KipI family sensor histidine kinase inhibitor
MKLYRAGDSSLFVNTGENISTEISIYNRWLIGRLTEMNLKGVTEFVSSYTGVMIYFDPLLIQPDDISSIIESLASGSAVICDEEAEGIVVPVAYGGEYGQDIDHVAELNMLGRSEVAAIHSSVDYTVHMLGFTPGFAYLGGMDRRISTPRKAEPAIRIEAGSVGIAGDQTGIYPVESPGGWQIVGRTPLILFDHKREPASLFRAGMKVRFRAVDNYEFWHICEEITSGEYKIEKFKTVRNEVS